MIANDKRRIHRTAIVLTTLAAITTLAAACSGSSSSDRQAALSRNVNLCVTNRTDSALGVEFKTTDVDQRDNTKETPVSIDPGSVSCNAAYLQVWVDFKAGSSAVAVHAFNDIYETKLSVTADGKTDTVTTSDDLKPGGNTWSRSLGANTISYGLNSDTDTKNFFVTVN
jgi:hypothetical protein